MLDLHIHLLHDIDDGPQEPSDSIAMLNLASELGYTTLVATPHLLDHLNNDYDALAQGRLDTLSQHATTRGITLLRGFEVRLTPDIGRRLQSGEPITLAGSNVVLVELPFSGWPIFTEHALFDILASGFVPLLAHPERYEAAVEKPERILDLHRNGVLMQVTTGSLAGLFGKRAQSLADQFLRADAVDVLATDAHSAGRRFVSVAEGLIQAERVVGRDRVRQLTVDNPRALLASELPAPSLAEVGSSERTGPRSKPWHFVRGVLSGR